ncbi:MAG: hypothetical protein PHW76_08715 [Alphaproteobacteria bacterium]|nr:hypothetical protein [Alphaproteobacteria bacterium]
MPQQNNLTQSHFLVIIPVVLIILGALVLSGTSIKENLRFSEAASQILSLVKRVRSYANDQQAFNFNPGEDILEALNRVGQLQSPKQTNPWRSPIMAVAGTNSTWRIESNYPVHVCRRLTLYIMEINTNETGLISIEAQTTEGGGWNPIFPSAKADVEDIVRFSCGDGTVARLALTFRAR